MSSRAVSSSLFRLAFLTLAAVWCRESVFRSALLCSSFCVWILHSSPADPSLHHHSSVLFIKVPAPLITIVLLFIVFTIWLLNKVPIHSQTCFLISNMTSSVHPINVVMSFTHSVCFSSLVKCNFIGVESCRQQIK